MALRLLLERGDQEPKPPSDGRKRPDAPARTRADARADSRTSPVCLRTRMPESAFERHIKEFLDDQIAPGDRVVDVGCGTGWAALFLARKKPGCRIHGIDIEAVRVHRANARFSRHALAADVTCTVGSATELTRHFGRASIDAIVAVQALHHFSDPAGALRQMRAILRPGGKILLAELDPWYGETLDDCPRYSPWKLKEFCHRAGFPRVSGIWKRPGTFLVLTRKPAPGAEKAPT